MSALRERIAEETKAAMKARDKTRVSALRLVNAALKQAEVDERKQLTDTDVVTVLTRMLKQRAESEAQYRAAGRVDLAEAEAYESAVIREFMPQPMSEAELDAAIARVVAAVGASSMRDMGRVINALRPEVQGRVDMALVSQRVKTALGG